MAAWRQWLAEPRGDHRADWRAAQTAKAIHDAAAAFAGKVQDVPLEKYKLEFRQAGDVRRNLDVARSVFGKVVPC